MCRNADGIPAALQRARIPQMAADALINVQAGDTPPDMGAMMANLDLRSLCQGLSSGGCCMGIALDVNKAMMDLNCMVEPLLPPLMRTTWFLNAWLLRW